MSDISRRDFLKLAGIGLLKAAGDASGVSKKLDEISDNFVRNNS